MTSHKADLCGPSFGSETFRITRRKHGLDGYSGYLSSHPVRRYGRAVVSGTCRRLPWTLVRSVREAVNLGFTNSAERKFAEKAPFDLASCPTIVYRAHFACVTHEQWAVWLTWAIHPSVVLSKQTATTPRAHVVLRRSRTGLALQVDYAYGEGVRRVFAFRHRN